MRFDSYFFHFVIQVFPASCRTDGLVSHAVLAEAIGADCRIRLVKVTRKSKQMLIKFMHCLSWRSGESLWRRQLWFTPHWFIQSMSSPGRLAGILFNILLSRIGMISGELSHVIDMDSVIRDSSGNYFCYWTDDVFETEIAFKMQVVQIDCLVQFARWFFQIISPMISFRMR